MSDASSHGDEVGQPTLDLHPSRPLSAGLLLSVLFPLLGPLPWVLSGGEVGGAREFAWAWGGLVLLVTIALLTVGVTRALAWQFFPERWSGLGIPGRLVAYILGAVPAALVFVAAADVGAMLFGLAADAAALLGPW